MRDAQTHSPSRIQLVSLVVPVICHPDAFNADYAVSHSLQGRVMNLKIHNASLQRIREIYGELLRRRGAEGDTS